MATTETKLSPEEIEQMLNDLPQWTEAGGVIQRTWQFKDFLHSMKFVNMVADLAESRQHHPDILVRYSKVTLSLSTHDAGGITKKDFRLAHEADAIAMRA